MKKSLMMMAAGMASVMGLSVLAENVLDRSSKSDTNEIRKVDADNTGRNVRDRDTMSVTPVTQGNSESDLSMTRRIRQAIMDSKDLSVNAKNVKIITSNGKVTLKGPVKSEEEKTTVSGIAEQIAQKANVENHLEVAKDNESRKD